MDRRGFLATAAAAVTGVRVFEGDGAAAPAAAGHYEYVIGYGGFDVYGIDTGHNLVKHVAISGLRNVRGACASPATGMLYIAYGDNRPKGTRAMLKYDLVADRVVWTLTYPIGVDSMAITPDGSTIYLPVGESSGTNIWYVVDAATGAVRSQIRAGLGPHNTVVSLDGQHVYLAGRNTNYLEVASTATNQVVARIGPLTSGVRPFTVTGRQTLAFTTATHLFGFEVSDIASGKRLFTVSIPGFTNTDKPGSSGTCPCHGISLSPDERELWLIDHPNRRVHVFDATPLPSNPTVKVADIAVSGLTGTETNCTHDCQREGWLHHSRSGTYVYVGDSGEVISTATRTVVANLQSMVESRVFLEIDYDASGSATATTSRYGLGYVV